MYLDDMKARLLDICNALQNQLISLEQQLSFLRKQQVLLIERSPSLFSAESGLQI